MAPPGTVLPALLFAEELRDVAPSPVEEGSMGSPYGFAQKASFSAL